MVLVPAALTIIFLYFVQKPITTVALHYIAKLRTKLELRRGKEGYKYRGSRLMNEAAYVSPV
jgi:hypothetical protein